MKGRPLSFFGEGRAVAGLYMTEHSVLSPSIKFLPEYEWVRVDRLCATRILYNTRRKELYPNLGNERMVSMGTAHKIAFWVVYVTWIIMEIVVNVRGTASSMSTNQDRGSVWVIYIGMYVVLLIAFGLAVNGLGLVVEYVGVWNRSMGDLRLPDSRRRARIDGSFWRPISFVSSTHLADVSWHMVV